VPVDLVLLGVAALLVVLVVPIAGSVGRVESV
jgi:hypothetical protein